MPTLQVPVPVELWQRVQSYRRMRGEKLGIPVVDLQIAVVKLLERGLVELEHEGRSDAPETAVDNTEDPRDLRDAEQDRAHLNIGGLDGPHRRQLPRFESIDGPLRCDAMREGAGS